MKLPVSFNSNYQVQDMGGGIVAEMWRNPNKLQDGPLIVKLLNEAEKKNLEAAERVEKKINPRDFIRQDNLPVLVAITESDYRLFEKMQEPKGEALPESGEASQETVDSGDSLNINEAVEAIGVAAVVTDNELTERCKPMKRRTRAEVRKILSEKMKESWKKRKKTKAG